MGLNMYAGGPLLVSGFLRTTGRPQQTMQNRLWLREERGLKRKSNTEPTDELKLTELRLFQ